MPIHEKFDETWEALMASRPRSRERGDLIADVVDMLVLDQYTKQDAFRRIADELGMAPGTIGAAYFRRQQAAGNGRAQQPAQVKSDVRWAAFNALIEEIVEERVAERLNAARRALS